MGWPVVIVDSGGLPVTEALNGLGVPVSVATNGFGLAVTLVEENGLPVVGSGGGVSDYITIPDTNTYPDERYSEGSFLAIQAVINTELSRTQTMQVSPSTFPDNTKFNWSWPADADDSVKSWNAIAYGDYLQTDIPAQIISSKISNIVTLTEDHTFTYSAPTESGNVALDFFLFTTPDSTSGNMACEVEVYFHTPDSTKAFVDSLTSLGTYTSAAIGDTPAITWNVGRQASNFYGTPYYLFYPADQSDQAAITFDVAAALAWLSTANPTTGITYLTGDEYYNGHAFGVETLKGSGYLLVSSLSVTYAAASTNLIPSAARNDLSDGFWSSQNVTASATQIMETAATDTVHGFYTPTGIAKSSVSKNYAVSFDVDTVLGRSWCSMQICTPDFGTGSILQYFDIGNGALGGNAETGSFTIYYGSVASIDGGKSRVTLVFNAGVSGVSGQDTGILVIFRIALGDFAPTYSGDITKGMNVSNAQFYEI